MTQDCLLLHRLRHLILHRVIQILCLQFAQRVARRFEVIRQLLRESLVEGGVFHVDDHAFDLLVGDEFGELVRLFLWRQCANGYIPRAIGQHNEQRFNIRVMDFFLPQHVRGEEQSC